MTAVSRCLGRLAPAARGCGEDLPPQMRRGSTPNGFGERRFGRGARSGFPNVRTTGDWPSGLSDVSWELWLTSEQPESGSSVLRTLCR